MSVKFLMTNGGDGKMHHYSRVKSTNFHFLMTYARGGGGGGGEETGRTGHTA